MKPIGDLFAKYKLTIKAPQGTVEKAFVESVKAVLGFDIDQDKVTYVVATKTVNLRLPALVKSEINLRKDEVVRHLNSSLGESG